jgi:hypothetical protein
MLLLLGWLLSFLGVGFFAAFPMAAIVDLVVSLAAFGLCMAAVVLALSGLQEYSRHPKRYRQGRAQAIWTLALSAMILTLLFVNVANARKPTQTSTGHFSSRPFVFANLNFKFLDPGERWIQLKTHNFGSNAALALRFERPEIDFVIIAERAPYESFSTENLADTAIEKLTRKSDSIRLLYRGPTRVDRLAGLRLHVETDRAGQKFYGEHRLFATNNLTYQLITSGAQKDKKSIADAAEFLSYRFELLDYSRPSHTDTNSEFRRRYLQ